MFEITNKKVPISQLWQPAPGFSFAAGERGHGGAKRTEGRSPDRRRISTSSRGKIQIFFPTPTGNPGFPVSGEECNVQLCPDVTPALPTTPDKWGPASWFRYAENYEIGLSHDSKWRNMSHFGRWLVTFEHWFFPKIQLSNRNFQKKSRFT